MTTPSPDREAGPSARQILATFVGVYIFGYVLILAEGKDPVSAAGSSLLSVLVGFAVVVALAFVLEDEDE